MVAGLEMVTVLEVDVVNRNGYVVEESGLHVANMHITQNKHTASHLRI